MASRYDENRDLGFGSVVSQQSERRLLNRDGSFNVVRDGLPWWAPLSPYHALLRLSWPKFLSLRALATGIIFARFAQPTARILHDDPRKVISVGASRLHEIVRVPLPA
jgi:hypothetical protein